MAPLPHKNLSHSAAQLFRLQPRTTYIAPKRRMGEFERGGGRLL